MNDAGPLLCHGCDKPLRKTVRRSAGHVWCATCLKKAVTHWACVDCGVRYTGAPQEPRGRCWQCRCAHRWRNEPCARCQKPIAKFGKLLSDERASCRSCAKYFRTESCHYCGQQGSPLSRDKTHGIDHLACGRCRYRLGKTRLCAGCHFPRMIAGERDGRGYCERCLPLGGPPLGNCQDCGHMRPMYRGHRCDDCFWAKTHRRLLEQLAPQIPSLWVRSLYYEYHQSLLQQVACPVVSNSVRYDLNFFIALAEHIASRDDLTGLQIVRRLGHGLVSKHVRVMSFLTATGYILTHEDPDYDLEWQLSRIRARIGTATEWSRPTLTRFLDHILRLRDRVLDKRARRRIPIKPKSILSAIQAATKFLAWVHGEGVRSAHEINQDVLELYLGQHRKQANAISAFIRYLGKRERTFGRLRVPLVSNQFHLRHRIPEHRRLALIEEFGRVHLAPSDQRWSLVCLFALLYMQPPSRSVAMRVDRIRDDGDDVHVLFARHWIELDPITRSAVRRWLETRREDSCFERTGESPWLFPGRHASNHAQSSTLGPWLRPHGVHVRALLQTSMASWVDGGVRNPHVLVEAFGMSRVTATSYCEHLGALLSPEAQHAFAKLPS